MVDAQECWEARFATLFVELLVLVGDHSTDLWWALAHVIVKATTDFKLHSMGVADLERTYHTLASSRTVFVPEHGRFVIVECLDL